MKTKPTAVSLIIAFLSALFLTNCTGPSTPSGNPEASAAPSASERQAKRSHRRMYGIDKGFTGNYGY